MNVSARSAFTLIELLVATALAMFLTSVVTTLWFQTEKAVERTRAILLLDLRARNLIDRTQELLDDRSGVFPMCAQNFQPSGSWDYRIRAFMSRAHIDHTSSGSSLETIDVNGVPLAKRWTRQTAPSWEGWRQSFSEPARDGFAPGVQIRSGQIGTNAAIWGNGEAAIRHSRSLKIPTTVAGVSWLRGGVAPGPSAPWVYIPHHYGKGDSFDPSKPNPYTAGNNQPPTSIAALDTTAILPARRFTGGSRTRVTNQWDGFPQVHRGPWRNATITPVLLHGQDVAWLGRTHLMRVINGPAYPGDLWLNGRYVESSTGIYPASGLASTTQHNEPPWMEAASLTAPANSVDPGLGRVRPPYGLIIDEDPGVTGTVGARWRVEAPLLSFATMIRGHRNIDLTLRNTGDGRYQAVLLPNSISLREAGGEYSDGTANTHGAHSDVHDHRWMLSANVSDFSIRTSVAVESPGGTGDPVSMAMQGRFGSLSNRSWLDGGAMPIDSAGYYGNYPTACEQSGVPVMVSVTLGVVGGFKDSESSAIERRWSVATQIR